jgi:hypothetical protein
MCTAFLSREMDARGYREGTIMNLFGTIALSCGLVLAGSAIAAASPENKIKANAVVCVTKSGIEATRADMNVKQLQSLGCSTAPTSLRFDILPPSVACDPYLFVAATLPDKILRYWIRRDELGDQVLNFAGEDAACRE